MKVLNVKKFLQTVHSRLEVGQIETKKSLLLAPDFLLECDDFLFQICDDPFEVKLRANYEVCPTMTYILNLKLLYCNNTDCMVLCHTLFSIRGLARAISQFDSTMQWPVGHNIELGYVHVSMETNQHTIYMYLWRQINTTGFYRFTWGHIPDQHHTGLRRLK